MSAPIRQQPPTSARKPKKQKPGAPAPGDLDHETLDLGLPAAAAFAKYSDDYKEKELAAFRAEAPRQFDAATARQ